MSASGGGMSSFEDLGSEVLVSERDDDFVDEESRHGDEIALADDGISVETDNSPWLLVGGLHDGDEEELSDEGEEAVEAAESRAADVAEQAVIEQVQKEVSAKYLWAAALELHPVALEQGVRSEHVGHGGDVSVQWSAALKEFPRVAGANCLGRLVVPRVSSKEKPLVAFSSVFLRNDGPSPWPERTTLRLVAGAGWGFNELEIGATPAGHVVKLLMDFRVPAEATLTEGERSAWVLEDGCGNPFGPLLVLEVLWA